MRLLIYGAGVIGSLYAVLLAEAGYDTSIYARGRRLEVLRTKGLLYLDHQHIKKTNVTVLSELLPEDRYDFVFLTVREEQLYQALEELKKNQSPCIVTMVNSIDEYDQWENICGKGRILPAFPGAGGSILDDVLDASLTPKIIQATTFAEISGNKTTRTNCLASIFQNAHIPYQMVKDMHVWQICHLAMVVPLADAYYKADDPEHAGKERKVMYETANQLKRNFLFLKRNLGTLSPGKMNLFLFVPLPILKFALSQIYESRFGNKFMYQHSLKAPDEMRRLHKQLYDYLNKK